MNAQTPNPPVTKTPTSAKAMSSSLKERLRKLGRYHESPQTTPSTSKATPDASGSPSTSITEGTRTPVLDKSQLTQRRSNLSFRMKRKFGDDDEEKHEPKSREDEEGNETKCKRRFVQTERVESSSVIDADTDQEKIFVREQIEERKETLRKLKLVKVYRMKNDLNVLDAMIDKWRQVCVEALNELRDKSPMEPKPTFRQLLDQLQIDHQLVRYDKDEDSFN